MQTYNWIFFFFTAPVFIRDSGMIPYIKIFLDDEPYRHPTLCILEQLSETNPEEYMSTAIGALCSSTETELQLKQDLLHVWILQAYYPFSHFSHRLNCFSFKYCILSPCYHSFFSPSYIHTFVIYRVWEGSVSRIELNVWGLHPGLVFIFNCNKL